MIVIGAPAVRLELAKKWGASAVINIDEVKEPARRKEQVLALTAEGDPSLSSKAPAFPLPSTKGWT